MCADHSLPALPCRSTRPEAPYLPSNIEYMAKNNGLSSKDEVRKACFEASYLVGA